MAKFERNVEVDSTVEKTWNVLIDPNYWPQWFPGIDSVSNVTGMHVGGTFEWVDDGKTGTGEILDIQPMRRLEVLTKIDNDKDRHVFELRATGGFLGLAADECKVDYTFDNLVGAGILGNFISGGNPKDAIRVKKAMIQLRKLVESL